MTEDFGREIGSKIGKVLEVDKRAIQVDQAKFLRLRVEMQLDKPLRRGGGYVKNDEDERIWVDFRYERLPIFCYICGILGHDEKHCLVSPVEHSSGRQYGEWLKVGGALKVGGEKVKLKEQPRVEIGSVASMGVNGESKEEYGMGGPVPPAMAVGGGAEAVKESVSMMEADRLECVMIPVRSNPGKHDEQVRMEEDVSEALRFGNDQRAREVSCGDQTDSVKT